MARRVGITRTVAMRAIRLRSVLQRNLKRLVAAAVF
jgi:hypothetical protein